MFCALIWVDAIKKERLEIQCTMLLPLCGTGPYLGKSKPYWSQGYTNYDYISTYYSWIYGKVSLTDCHIAAIGIRDNDTKIMKSMSVCLK